MTTEETHDAVFGLVDEADDAKMRLDISAKMRLDISAKVLTDFQERWLDDCFPTDETIFEIRRSYALLQAHWWLITNTICETRERLEKLIEEGREICKSLK